MFAKLALLALPAVSALSDETLFELFKSDFVKVYESEVHETERFGIFQDNLRMTEAKNAEREDEDDAEFGVTKFMDLTAAEFKAQYLNYKPDGEDQVASTFVADPIAAVPNSTDWRTKQKDVVSPVKDQGQCGSCWAFSTTEQIESDWVLAGNAQKIFAPQQIVSCDEVDQGCNGGNTETAYAYVEKAGGMALESAYPYTSGASGDDGKCKKDLKVEGGDVSGYTYVVPKCASGACNHQNEDAMVAAVAQHGPASICVDAGAWQTYTKGVMSNRQCGSHSAMALDHCVQVVGYSGYTGDAKKCAGGFLKKGKCIWNVRNSWNTNWGINGYIRLQMGKNTCGIANDATFAKITKSE